MELIPLTDFDKRAFPEITEDEKVHFILNTNLLERSELKEDTVRSSLLMPQKADPLVSGQMRVLEMIQKLALNQDLIPKPDQIQPETFNKLFSWLFEFHGNMLYDLAKKGEELQNEFDYPLLHELGKYRTEEKNLGHRKMPSPYDLKDLLAKAFKEYAQIYHKYHELLSSPRMMEEADWKRIERAAYKLNLAVCCIKPFKDGSNRIARLVENLVRLNCGLKFKILKDKDKLLQDIWNLQDSEYKVL